MFERHSDRETNLILHQHIASQVIKKSWTGPGPSQVPGTPFKSPTLTAGLWVLEPLSTASPSSLAGSQIESRATRIWAITAVWVVPAYVALWHTHTSASPQNRILMQWDILERLVCYIAGVGGCFWSEVGWPGKILLSWPIHDVIISKLGWKDYTAE